jgi:hypothetical protein
MRSLVIFVLLGIVGRSGSVGIKRRLAQASDAPTDVATAIASSSEVPRRGGVRRRLAAEEPEVVAESGPLNAYLKTQWAGGHLNTRQVQEIAYRATQQGASGAERLGAMGCEGAHSQNLFRAFKTLLGTPRGAPDFYWAEIPLKSGPKIPHPFLLLHQFFANFFRDCRRQWVQAVGGPVGAARQFWKSVAGLDFVTKHPSLPQSLWGQSIPLGLHGDGGAFSKQDNLYVISWNSLLGCGSTIEKRFVCTVVRKSDMTAATLDAIFEVLSWSFNVLLSGSSPSLDYLGRPLSGGGAVLADGYRLLWSVSPM